ncbi:MAG: hypothetical protein ACP5I2_07565 [Fervidicoccaceae archaeon]
MIYSYIKDVAAKEYFPYEMGWKRMKLSMVALNDTEPYQGLKNDWR